MALLASFRRQLCLAIGAETGAHVSRTAQAQRPIEVRRAWQRPVPALVAMRWDEHDKPRQRSPRGDGRLGKRNETANREEWPIGLLPTEGEKAPGGCDQNSSGEDPRRKALYSCPQACNSERPKSSSRRPDGGSAESRVGRFNKPECYSRKRGKKGPEPAATFGSFVGTQASDACGKDATDG